MTKIVNSNCAIDTYSAALGESEIRHQTGTRRNAPTGTTDQHHRVKLNVQLNDNEPGVRMKTVTGLAALTLLLVSMNGFADGNPLVGTWKLKSYVMTTTAGERSTPFGEHPSGYLSYSPDGRMYAIGTADGRTTPHDIAATDEERAILHRTMFAYAGTFSIGPDKVIHHVDISWNELWNGTDQVRFYKLTGNTLTITTARSRSGFDGRESQSVLVWQRVAATP